MDNQKFVELVKKAVVDYFNSHKEITDNGRLTPEDVYVVWLCKTLQNNKALLNTTVLDGMYYVATYNGDKNEMYLDAYKKWDNKRIKIEE
uniref:Phage protein n=1 Tax=Siphoviridae sp. ctnpt50 TaxID=2827941 RepID=A0A8S5SD58_9CAUD|nr:MAG TPA: hypothetical protein [Siphoviridae sp. ctnpt50]